MGGDDDIAASLPRPPFPAPARREAAIEEALRRFDGGSAGAAMPAAGKSAPAPGAWWARPVRPYAPALAGAFLVALIALPLIWMSPEGRSVPEGGGSPGPATVEGVPPASAVAAADYNPVAPGTAPSPA